MEIAAGIDFGGTFAKIGLVERTGRIRSRTQVAMDPRESFEGIVAPVERTLRALIGKEGSGDSLAAIGIGTPGFIDKTEGILIGGCENIPSLQNRSVQDYLARAFGVPAYSENDATSAAAGELAFGAGRSFSSFVLITVGTAIGGGLVLNGRVYRGWRGFAGEIGHLCVNRDGLWCSCGSRGCLEQYASGTAMLRVYAEKLRKRGKDPGGSLSTRDVVDRAKAGDPFARDTMEEAGAWIAQAFGSLLNVLDVEACIVGGGVSEAGDVLLEPIRRHLPDHCWPQIGRDVSVRAAELRNDAGILGAAAQAYERLAP
ncbi:MAG: ROK family protein [Spirochaetia bacterium]